MLEDALERADRALLDREPVEREPLARVERAREPDPLEAERFVPLRDEELRPDDDVLFERDVDLDPPDPLDPLLLACGICPSGELTLMRTLPSVTEARRVAAFLECNRFEVVARIPLHCVRARSLPAGSRAYVKMLEQ